MTHAQATQLGQSYVGKTGQSRILTEINERGQKVMSAPQKITGFEVVREFGEYSVMLCVGGDMVFEDLVINVK